MRIRTQGEELTLERKTFCDEDSGEKDKYRMKENRQWRYQERGSQA